MTALLEATALVKSYGRAPALRGVSLPVAEGEVVAITGPSGSGKSTLLLCLAGVLQPDSGTVTFRGEPVHTRTEAQRSRLRRTDFGVLFQFGHLVDELSAVENVALPLLLAGTGRREAERVARGWLDRLGVIEVARARPGALSGGELQRVALARALVTGPAVLFADEPTGALDTLSGERVLTELVRVAREVGTAVLLVTHDATVAGYADREVHLRDGLVESPVLEQR